MNHPTLLKLALRALNEIPRKTSIPGIPGSDPPFDYVFDTYQLASAIDRGLTNDWDDESNIEWVPVTHALPPLNKRVLVCRRNHAGGLYWTVGRYTDGKSWDASHFDDIPDEWYDEEGAQCHVPAGWYEEPAEVEQISRLEAVMAWARPPLRLGTEQLDTIEEAMAPAPSTHGVMDPEYARFLSKARVRARAYGWAIAIHGSCTRDFDLIAVPWTESCRLKPAYELVRHIVDSTGMRFQNGNPTRKEHGRLVWTLLMPDGNDPRFIDFSVIPPSK